jgi:transcriptional regulator of acetoin/glycerol metabolism
MDLEPLVLPEVSHSVWAGFAAASSPEPSPVAAHPVIDCWRRARALGAPIEGRPAEDLLLRGEALQVRRERSDLVTQSASRELQRALGATAARDFVLLLADTDGVVLEADGGGAFADEARRVRLIPGASWREADRGTNAIGTALTEARPVFVQGRAHYASLYHPLVCYAAPIFDADGSLVAVLDATSFVQCSDDAVGELVVGAAAAITQALRERALGRVGASVARALSRTLQQMRGVALLVDARGKITQVNHGARRLLGECVGAELETTLGIDLPGLREAVRRHEGLTLTIGTAVFGLRAEPIETVEGKLIAMLLMLESRAAAPLLARPRLAAAPATFGTLFSRDPACDAALAAASRLASGCTPLLLSGEGGTGKQSVARAMHAVGGRGDAAFVVVSAGTLSPAALTESLAAAAGGTLFFEEIADLPLVTQSALQRYLDAPFAGVRIVAATCRDLPAAVTTGTFRRDLYFLLESTQIALPPLRKRIDLTALAGHLLAELAAARHTAPPELSPEVVELFGRCAWPGNTRQLRAVLDASVELAALEGELRASHLPPGFVANLTSPLVPTATTGQELAVAEANALRRALEQAQGNLSEAARRLGVARTTLYRMMRRHGVRS